MTQFRFKDFVWDLQVVLKGREVWIVGALLPKPWTASAAFQERFCAWSKRYEQCDFC